MRGRGRPRRADICRQLAIQITELRDRLGGLPSPAEAEAAGIWRGIWYEEAHHSTAIEGNTLVLKQVERLLDEGRAVGNKELREYMEVRGYADAADWVYRRAISPNGLTHPERILSLEEVRHVHRTALTPAWQVSPHPTATPREAPGNFREHEIHPFPSGMMPVSWPFVPGEMTAWVDRVNALEATEATFPEALAAAHGRFEQIHPFLDGNGRTGRLILNLILVRLGYPPAIIYKRDRARYLQALRRADAGESSPLGEMLARAILNSLHRFVIPAVAGPARLVPLAALGTPAMKAPALRAAAERGRLRATRGPDGHWRSSRRWVDEYVASRYRRDTRTRAGGVDTSVPSLPPARPDRCRKNGSTRR